MIACGLHKDKDHDHSRQLPGGGQPELNVLVDELKLYIYAHFNRVQSSRRIEREAQCNVEVMWLTGRLSPDHKTISDFRKDNNKAVRGVCREFVVLCRRMDLFSQSLVVIDGSKLKAVNNCDKNFTRAKMKRRLAQVEASLDRYFEQLEQADREESSVADVKTVNLKDKLTRSIKRWHG